MRKEKKMGRVKYTSDLPRRMYTYFASYSDSVGAPSFAKFARSVGVTLGELEGYRRHGKFDRAYRECNEIRRDYLIDMALSKRFDSSFTKFLICEEYTEGKSEGDGVLNVVLEVVDK